MLLLAVKHDGMRGAITRGAVILIYVFEILIDNTFARFRWELAFRSAWLVALVLGGGNLIALYALMGGA